VSERWAKPATIYDAVEGDTLMQMPGGELMIQAEVSVDEETVQRMRSGYICIMCLEPQKDPFPKKCALCGYHMRDRQSYDLSTKRNSLNEVWVGSRINTADEIARMDEHYEYERRTGIILPDNVKFPNETREEKGR
jgi:hypothetical protein